jgi:hypothetical protein
MTPRKVSILSQLFGVDLSLEKREKQLERELFDVRVSRAAVKEAMRREQAPESEGKSAGDAITELIHRWESDKEELAEQKRTLAAIPIPDTRMDKKVQEMDAKFDPPKPSEGKTVTTIITPAPDPDRKPN